MSSSYKYLSIEVTREKLRGDSSVLTFETSDIEVQGRIKETDIYSIGMLDRLGMLGWELVSELPMAMKKEGGYYFPARIMVTLKKAS